jgi:hypothetical protein
MAKIKPAKIDHLIPVRSLGCLRAKGSVSSDPPRFLQKINVGIGIALIAISGPDVPIPMIPTPRRIKSGFPGIVV